MSLQAEPADSRVLGKIAEKSSHSVTYSADTIASWSAEEKISKAKRSLYYTASESEGRSEIGSVYDAVSLADSDEDFQIEVARPSEYCCDIAHACAYAVHAVRPGRTALVVAVWFGQMLHLHLLRMLNILHLHCICTLVSPD